MTTSNPDNLEKKFPFSRQTELLSNDWITNRFLQQYLCYVEQTEAPKLFHIWALLACVSACMGRHCWLETGIGKHYANLYVLLVGPPATKKGTSIKFATNLIKQATSVRFAPKDTGGKRQGLITAMEKGFNNMESSIENALLSLDNIAKLNFSTNDLDRHCMFICASEFGSFIGQNNLEFTRFLLEMWDGEDYPYQLKNELITLKDPLLALLGGTTASEISALLPPEAIGQGFMSRIILVFSPHKEKHVALSKAKILKHMETKLKETLSWIEKSLTGPIKFSKDAEVYSDALELRSNKINDTRFIYYSERRHIHLLKTTMCLTALNKSNTIEREDLEQADILLSAVEEFMPDALGEYGLSPLALSKQKIVEFIRHAKEPVTQQVLWVVMQRDIKLIDFRNCLIDLCNAKKIIEVQTTYGTGYIYNDPVWEAVELLAIGDVQPEPKTINQKQKQDIEIAELLKRIN